jgi:hypothetical protein
VLDLKRGPLSLMSTTEELLGRKSSGSGLETREYGRRDSSRWPRGTLYSEKLVLTSPTRGGRSVGIVRSRTKATECVCFFFCILFLVWSVLYCLCSFVCCVLSERGVLFRVLCLIVVPLPLNKTPFAVKINIIVIIIIQFNLFMCKT